ncbi:LytR C-terminal domain-containing protein [Kocuria sp.]|uniref:LytR C-terminal domain-containing protein n=1 Tax=Kocuria sp. TaxID=1871328 RepID=UPI0026E046C5|nr:LytR C-terminal domain-containing protein [Kocuria sp.]MDO5619533.1 LytR C-terminal domain-containing protein [Kocuria sp.]
MTSPSQPETPCTSASSPQPAAGESRFGHDIFDDVPEDGARAGTHRALDAPNPRATKEILALLVAGAVALTVGAVAYLVGVDPNTRTASASATSSPTAQATTALPGATVAPDGTLQVGVYNAASVDGAAGQAAQQLSAAGWNVASIDNWGVGVNNSVVYYADDESEQAQAIADELGIDMVVEEDAVSYPIVVVIGTDIAGGPTAEPVQEAPVQEAPVEQAPVEQAPVEQAPVEEVPVEQVPVDQVPVEQAPVQEYVEPVTDPYAGF